MKQFILIVLTTTLFACNNHRADKEQELQQKLNSSYNPGFGDFMNSIQVHHAKLWFAGINQNWELADFEIHEIEEGLNDIKEYHADRSETRSIDMIDKPLANVSNAIQKKNESDFKSNYTILTNTCNSCHQATQHGFIQITVPETPPFSNQIFTLKDEPAGTN